MIRIVVFLVLTAAFAKYVAVWLADHPGEVSITWLGYHAEPPIGILIAVIACAAVLLAVRLRRNWSVEALSPVPWRAVAINPCSEAPIARGY